MKQLTTILLWCTIAACSNSPQTTTPESGMSDSVPNNTANQDPSLNLLNRYGFDNNYSLSKTHHPYLVTGYFNDDKVLDTAIIVRHQPGGHDELLIVHGHSSQSVLITNSEDLGADFGDFNWAERFEVIKKGTTIWDDANDSEIETEDTIPNGKEIILPVDGILLHMAESCSGGILYFKNGAYTWVHQE